MTTNTYKSQNLNAFVGHLRLGRGMAFGVIIITALLAFEIFNYGTTDFALTDLLGELKFMGLRWATILSIAFCGIDFAGIARLFAPEPGKTVHNETWYLFGAWLLAATMNAMLTWWGVSLAILNHQTLGNAVLEREVLLRTVPIFVAILVWLIRVLIIGTFSVAGEHLFELDEEDTVIQHRKASRPSVSKLGARTPNRPASRAPSSAAARTGVNPASRPAPRVAAPASNNMDLQPTPSPAREMEPEYVQAELTYHPVSMQGRTLPAGTGADRAERYPPRAHPGKRSFN